MSAKPLVVAIVLVGLALPAQAQFKIGLKIAPALNISRIGTLDSTTHWSTNAVAARFIFGPFVDIAFSENYYITTGLWYAPKQLTAFPATQTTADVRRVQYLQVPLALKLYTDEIRLDTRLYFQMGGIAEVKVGDRDMDLSLNYVPEANLFDGSVLLAVGVEYRWGYNTTTFGGLTYQRGLFNVVSGAGNPRYDLKTDMVGLDFGLRF